jgi:hypothetical protein
MTGARQTIAVKIIFRKSNKNSLQRREGAYRPSRKKRPIFPLYSIIRFTFITERDCVYSAVRAESLNVMQVLWIKNICILRCNFSNLDCSMHIFVYSYFIQKLSSFFTDFLFPFSVAFIASHYRVSPLIRHTSCNLYISFRTFFILNTPFHQTSSTLHFYLFASTIRASTLDDA